MKRPALASTLFLALALDGAVGQGQPQSPDSGPLPDMQVNSRAAPCVRLRSGASTDHSAVDCLETGTRLRLLGEASGWSHVLSPDGTEGWIDSGYLEAAPAPQPAAGPPSDLQWKIRALEAQLAAQRARVAELEKALAEAEQAQRIESLTGDLADAQRKTGAAMSQPRPASRPERAPERPAESGVKVRAPIGSDSATPKVSVRMPAAASAPQPTPPPEKPAEPPIPTTDAAIDAIRAWAAAWSEQRVDDYLSFYARRFRPPDGLGRDAWETQRRQRLSRPRFIRVTISRLSAQLADDGTVTATFRQGYESDGFADTVTKTMTLAEEDGAWRVLSERVTP